MLVVGGIAYFWGARHPGVDPLWFGLALCAASLAANELGRTVVWVSATSLTWRKFGYLSKKVSISMPAEVKLDVGTRGGYPTVLVVSAGAVVELGPWEAGLRGRLLAKCMRLAAAVDAVSCSASSPPPGGPKRPPE